MTTLGFGQWLLPAFNSGANAVIALLIPSPFGFAQNEKGVAAESRSRLAVRFDQMNDLPPELVAFSQTDTW